MFTFAIILNCLAVLLVIANAIYNAVYLDPKTESTGLVNSIGIGYVLIIFACLHFRNTGKPILAMFLAWGPALPVLFICFYCLMILLIGGEWK